MGSVERGFGFGDEFEGVVAGFGAVGPGDNVEDGSLGSEVDAGDETRGSFLGDLEEDGVADVVADAMVWGWHGYRTGRTPLVSGGAGCVGRNVPVTVPRSVALE
jgi:hypothetical protein